MMREGAAPLVGLPCYAAEVGRTRRPVYANNQSYVQALLAAGATPLLIPPGLSPAALAALCAHLDGLLLPGGADIDPARYGEETLPECGSIEPERDAMELELTTLALRRDMPIFGICRGMQTLNVACGGSLYQDITSQLPGSPEHARSDQPRDFLAHSMRVEPDSRLAEILGATELRVNSLHHQAVKRPADSARIVAWSSDGLAEGMEAPDRRFVLAVQYHPEELAPTDAASRRLFEAFVQACCEG